MCFFFILWDKLLLLSPSLAAPTSTCSSMQYIQDSLSRIVVASCYFPLHNNCSVLTCPVNDGLDLTLSILRCADPPAVRISYGNGFFTVFDHTFDHSEVVPIEGAPNNTALDVTLEHLCPSDIGLQASVVGCVCVCVFVCACDCLCVVMHVYTCHCRCVCICVWPLFIYVCIYVYYYACTYTIYVL